MALSEVCTAYRPAISCRSLEQFLGSAAGLSSATISRLTKQWTDDYHAFCQRDLSQVDYVYIWVDCIHVNIRLEKDKLCLLVIVGVRADGSTELVALADGYRESAGSWADLLRDCARRGMRAPILAVGDGALGFWVALREVPTHESSATGSTRPPTSSMPCPNWRIQLRRPPCEIYNAEDRNAYAAAKRFDAAYGVKFPKAAKKISDDLEVLPAFYDFPAEHWIHLRTSNPIESTFATVRHRSRVTDGSGSRTAGLAMALKLAESAQDRWRAVNAPHLVALVRAGAKFHNGQLVERPEVKAA